MKAARTAGTITSYDLNYRKKLWDASAGRSSTALEVNRGIVSSTDVLIGNEEDLQLGLGIAGPEVSSSQSRLDTRSFRAVIERTRKEYPHLKAIATTLREVRSASRHAWKALLWYDGQFHETPELELDVYDRIGGGDGFSAGLIYGLLSGEAPDVALKLGWAHGALLTTYPGDISMARLDQVRALAEGSGARVVR
jgi:2-dehydro-3-deoxygluconokinase